MFQIVKSLELNYISVKTWTTHFLTAQTQIEEYYVREYFAGTPWNKFHSKCNQENSLKIKSMLCIFEGKLIENKINPLYFSRKITLKMKSVLCIFEGKFIENEINPLYFSRKITLKMKSVMCIFEGKFIENEINSLY